MTRKRVRPVHGPHGASRSRGHRFTPTAAVQVVSALRRFSGEATPLGSFAQLMALSLSDSSADVLALLPIACGRYDVRAVLRHRAQQALSVSEAPVISLWCPAAEARWPAEFLSCVRTIWYAIDRTAGGSRSASSTSAAGSTSSSSKSLAVPPPLPLPRKSPPPRVGRITCLHPDVLPEGLPSESVLLAATVHSIREHRPARVPLVRSLGDVIPASDGAVHANDSQQRAQLARFRATHISRTCIGEPDGAVVVFQPAKLSTALQSCSGWKRGATGSAPPPLASLRKAVWTHVSPAALASSNHHPWDARAIQPFTALQMCAYFGLLAFQEALSVAAAAVTACQFRSLLGQACHAASITFVLRRALRRVDPSVRSRLRTFAALGAGINTIGLVMLHVLGLAARYVWWAEACPIARAAHTAMWRHLGSKPVHWTRAEDPALASPRWRVDIELLSLRCAPFSPKSMQFPRGCAAALQELAAVLRGVAARRPTVVIYENTAGLWRTPLWRARVEFMLRYYLPEYDWEGMLLSPHWHSDVPVRRTRVFYTAVLRSAARRSTLPRPPTPASPAPSPAPSALPPPCVSPDASTGAAPSRCTLM